MTELVYDFPIKDWCDQPELETPINADALKNLEYRLSQYSYTCAEQVADSIPAGPAGPQGPVGPAGPQGPLGLQGPAGTDGAQGPPGASGAQGPPGTQGAKGDPGTAGAQGAQGPKGDTGAQGDAGPGMPIGAPIPWLVAAIPSGYLELNGQACPAGTYPKLNALYGANLPDLRGRMLLHANATYPIKSTGGEAAHALTAAESGVPAHGHGISGQTGAADRSLDHLHVSPVSGYQYLLYIGEQFGGQPGTGTAYPHGAAANTGAMDRSIDHLHGVGSLAVAANSAANAANAHNNLPPYVAVLWITLAG
jgi:microcystin-dependent protein